MPRPDLSFAFAELSKFAQNPGTVHLKAARRTLAYLVGTADRGITYSRPEKDSQVNKLHGWVDSDYASDPDNRCSTTGYVISMSNGPISWKAKRQSCTTLSSAEAEFVAASVCGQEVIYLWNLLRDLEYAQRKPMRIHEDNASAILMSENPVNAERSKHIDMVRGTILKLKKVAGTQNVADALTKSLPSPSFYKHWEHLFGSRVPFEAFYVSIGALSYPSAHGCWTAFQASLACRV
eukprot:2671714-Rhodomonas_salina.1